MGGGVLLVLPIAQASVLRWVLMGGISANQIFFGMAFVAGVLVLVRWLVPALVGMGCWERSGVLVVGLCLVHCWVLRQQDLFAAMRGTVLVFLCFLRLAAAALVVCSFWGGLCGGGG
jgi:hypothetical protein